MCTCSADFHTSSTEIDSSISISRVEYDGLVSCLLLGRKVFKLTIIHSSNARESTTHSRKLCSKVASPKSRSISQYPPRTTRARTQAWTRATMSSASLSTITLEHPTLCLPLPALNPGELVLPPTAPLLALDYSPTPCSAPLKATSASQPPPSAMSAMICLPWPMTTVSRTTTWSHSS